MPSEQASEGVSLSIPFGTSQTLIKSNEIFGFNQKCALPRGEFNLLPVGGASITLQPLIDLPLKMSLQSWSFKSSMSSTVVYFSYLLVIYGARSIYFKNGQRKQRAIFSISAIKQQGRFFSCLGLFHVELETKHQYPTLQFPYYILTYMFGDTFSITSSLPVFSAFLNSSILFSLYRYIPSYIISYIIPYTIPFIIPIIIFITIPLLLSLLFFAIPVWLYQRA